MMTEAGGQQPARKLLQDMTPEELQAWYLEHRAELEDFCSYAQRWRKGRARRGIQTLNDDRYDQFLAKAPDLIAGLEELRQAAERAAQQEEQQ